MSKPIKAMIYGDSVMKGTVMDCAYRYHAIMEKSLALLREHFNIETENKSRFGITVDKGYSIIKKDIANDIRADYALVEFGGNDCNFKWNEISLEPDGEHEPLTRICDFYEIYHEIIHDLKSRDIQPVLMTLPPIDAERYLAFLERNGNNGQNILHWLGDVQMIYRFHEAYSNKVAKIAAETNCPLVDVRSFFLDKLNYRKLMCIDGVHPNEDGHQLIYGAFSNFIETAMPNCKSIGSNLATA